MKKTLLILSLLIASLSYSQDTIPITVNQAKQAIINAQKVESLSHYIEAQEIQIVELEGIISSLESVNLNKNEQIRLLEENNSLLKDQLKKKNSIFEKITLFLAGAGLVLLFSNF